MTKMESVLSKSKLNLGVDRYQLFIMFIGFFLGRVNIIDRLTPFSIAFLASYIILKGVNRGLLVSVILGTFSFHGFNGAGYYMTSIIIYALFGRVKDSNKLTLLSSSLITGGLYTIIRGSLILVSGQLFIYDLFLAGFEGLLIFTMTYIFSFSLPIEGLSKQKITNEKLVCSFITLALVLSGFNNLFIFGISVKNVISVIIIIYLSYSQGVLMGVTSGIVLGLVSYISQTEMPFIIAILGVSGLLAGLFKDLGKAGSVLGFILGNGIISFYINGLGTSFLDYKEIFISSILFLAISYYFEDDINRIFSKEPDIRSDYEDRKVEIIIHKLDKMVDLFNSLSKTFKDTIIDVDSYSNVEVYSLIDSISNNACATCSNHEKCWEENYYTSYYKIFNLVGLMENNLEKEETFEKELKSFCKDEDNLSKNLKASYELFKHNKIWNNKLNEQRLLVADQLEGLGHVIEKISGDMYTNPIFNEELEHTLLNELKNLRIGVEDIKVAELETDNIEILVDFNDDDNINEKIDRVRKVVSQSLGYPLTSNYIYSNKSKSKTFKLIRSNNFQSMTKVCGTPNSEGYISGDNYTFGEVDNISFIAISAGMGIGKRANMESSTAINLLEKLMEANLDKEMTIKTINSVLRTKSNDEIFTTLDLGFVDLYSGKLQMVKTGSPPTFIKKKDRVEMINSQCLPIGILKDIDFKVYEENLEDGDLIIMMSDGVLDSNSNVDNSEKWMQNVIMGIQAQSPQAVADEILNIAHFMTMDKLKDDMTVMVTKIWKSV